MSPLRPGRWLIVRANQGARRWWPLIASLVAGMVIFTMGYVVDVVAQERDQLRLQNEQLTAQADQLAEIIERNDRFDAEREQRLGQAVDDVEALLVDQFGRHDENVALKLNDLLHQVAALLDRPAGTPPNPVSAVTPRRGHPSPAPAPSAAPRSEPRSAPTHSTAPPTTTPDQRSCAKRPSGPRC